MTILTYGIAQSFQCLTEAMINSNLYLTTSVCEINDNLKAK